MMMCCRSEAAAAVKGVREIKVMVKKLKGKEKQQSRQLWEEIFTEDSKEFLDYYYTEKLKNNQILGSFEKGKLVSMLHLNPYRLCVGKYETVSEYIVAVATKKEYRHQGKMAELLHQAMLEAKKEESPFVFLMPAKEAIYHPFGFVTVYERKDYCVTRQMLSEAMEKSTLLKKGNTSVFIEEIAESASEEVKWAAVSELIKYSQSRLEKHYQVFAKRDQQYYTGLLKEQNSQQGSILLARDSSTGKICGYCFMTKEGEVQLRELVCDVHRETEILNGIWQICGIERELKIFGGEFEDTILPVDKNFPCIMARITDVCKFAELIPLGQEERQWIKSYPRITIVDSFMKENQGQYVLKLEKKGGEFFAKAEKQGDSSGESEELPLYSPVFTIEEILRKSFQKLKIFLNEVV